MEFLKSTQFGQIILEKALGEMWRSEIYQEFGATGSELQVSAHKRMKIKILVKFIILPLNESFVIIIIMRC